MNIFQKLSTYITILRLSKSHRKAKYAFAGRLAESDYYLAVIIIAIIALCVVVKFSNEIDGITTASAENVAKARQIANQAYADKQKSELIIISMLNGKVIKDGVTRSVCLMTSAGDCE